MFLGLGFAWQKILEFEEKFNVSTLYDTVDGINPARPGMYQTLQWDGYGYGNASNYMILLMLQKSHSQPPFGCI